MKLPRPLGLATVERSGDGYIDLMARVNLIADYFKAQIKQHFLLDMFDIRAQESDIIWFRIPTPEGERGLLYDFGLVSELDHELIRILVVDEIGRLDVVEHLFHAHRDALMRVGRSSGAEGAAW